MNLLDYVITFFVKKSDLGDYQNTDKKVDNINEYSTTEEYASAAGVYNYHDESKADVEHSHEDYCLQEDINNQLDTKADNDHSHNDLYYTETEIDEKLNLKVSTESGKSLSTNDYTNTDKSNLTGAMSDIDEIESYIPVGTSSLNQLADKSYVDTEIGDAIDNVTQFDYELQNTLPSSGSKGIIYLIGESAPYDEYLWVNDNWLKIGTTSIEFSNYYTKSETYEKQEVDGLIKEMQVTGNMVQDINSSSTDDTYPSSQAVYNYHDSTKADLSIVPTNKVTLQFKLTDNTMRTYEFYGQQV